MSEGPQKRTRKGGKLGNYSPLCDAKECNVEVNARARLRGNYEKSHRSHVEYLFIAQRESMVFAKMQLFFFHVIRMIFFSGFIVNYI